jgi:GT2 family glycosyltransferase
VTRLRAARDDIELLEMGVNGGYAAAANAGLRLAASRGDEYVWLLNNDLSVAPDSLAALVVAAEADDSIAAVASAVWDTRADAADDNAFIAGPPRDDTPQDTAAPYPLPTFVPDRVPQVPLRCSGCEGGYHDADVLRGPSLLLRTAAIESIGGLDEDYFHYYEEVDLIVRLRRAGWKVGLVCGAKVVHHAGTSLSGGSAAAHYYTLRNYLRFRRRLFGEHPLRVVARDTRRGRRLVSVRRLVRLDARATFAGVRAIVDAFRGRFGPREFGPRYREPLP